MAGIGGGLYIMGHFTHDDHEKETAILAGEAALNSYLVTTGLKYTFGLFGPSTNPNIRANSGAAAVRCRPSTRQQLGPLPA